MARKRASMREGPLAELFRATEAAQQQQGKPETEPEPEPRPEVKAPPVEPLQPPVAETSGKASWATPDSLSLAVPVSVNEPEPDGRNHCVWEAPS